MSLRIAICDDVTVDRQAIVTALDEYNKIHGILASVEVFQNPRKLLAIAKNEPFDLYLLDVLLDDEFTGIELVRKLRTGNGKVPVVFFSTSREYAIDAFAVEAISYLEKPWDKAAFVKVMDLAMESCRKRQNSMLTLRTGSGVACFEAYEIESVETANTVNYISIKRSGGNSVIIRGSVRSFAAEHRDMINLVPAGRSILVNPAQIASLEKASVRFFSGRTIEIPRSSFASISKAILSLSAP